VLVVVVVAGTLLLIGSWGFSTLRSRVGGSLRRRLRGATPHDAIAGAYDRTLAHLARRGWAREAWMTPAEYLGALELDWTPELAEAFAGLKRLTGLFQAAHYGGEASTADQAAAEEAARSVCRLAARRKPRRTPTALSKTAAAEGAA
jgi:hypothetical protein